MLSSKSQNSSTHKMRKITDFTSKKNVVIFQPPQPTKKARLYSSLPFDLHYILKKYDSRFDLLRQNQMFTISKVHISKAYKKYIEQKLVCFENTPFKHDLSNFYNLKTIEIVGAESFNFISCYRCERIKLNLVSVANSIVDDVLQIKDDIMISHIVLRKLTIDVDTLRFVISLPSLEGITLDNVNFEGKHDYVQTMIKIIELLNQNKNITTIKITDKRFDQAMINLVDLTKLTRYKFTDLSYTIDCNITSTTKNHLFLENCKEYNL